MTDESYYRQPELWNREREQYQVQVLEDIIALLPKDALSILDIGCGDGFITNSLPEGIRVVGFDISDEALKYVKREKHVGSITETALEGGSFDLVMANDVMEHIPDDVYGKAVSEVFRIASKYVMLTVPFGEQLEKSSVKCAACGQVYHINLHQRSYTEKELVSLCPKGWSPLEIRYSGDTTRPPYDPLTQLYREFNVFIDFDNCVCPKCGSKVIVRPRGEYIERILNKLRADRLFSGEVRASMRVNRTEIIALYGKEELAAGYKGPATDVPAMESASLLVADFSNRLQRATGFVEGSAWTRYLVKDGNIGHAEAAVNFPVIPRAGDRIIVKTCGAADISAFASDFLRTTDIPLKKASQSGSESVFNVDSPWSISMFGAFVKILVRGEGGIESAEYLPVKPESYVDNFVRLHEGHNVLATGKSGYFRSWGFFTQVSALFPMPEWLWEEDVTPLVNVRTAPVSLVDFKETAERLILEFKDRLVNLNALLEEKEAEREKAEKECKDRLVNLNALLEEKEHKRDNAEKAYHAASCRLNSIPKLVKTLAYVVKLRIKSVLSPARHLSSALPAPAVIDEKEKRRTEGFKTLYAKKSAGRRFNRILVLSNMFPNERQRNSGCFIAEQVGALREFEGVDARVVSGQPFWVNTPNPVRLLRTLPAYRAELFASRWRLEDGVPALLIPYLVGYPYLTFYSHGFTYRSSVKALAESIRKDFEFDLIHAHTGYLDGFAGLYLARRFNVPLVVTEHTGPFSNLTGKQIVRQITVKSLSSADRIICVSPSLEKDVKGWLAPEVHKRMMVVPNGVDTDLFKPADGPGESRPVHAKRLLAVISLDENKNPFCLLEALRKLRAKEAGLTLKIVGEGHLREPLERWIREQGVGSSVSLIGPMTRTEITRLMRDECDLLVLPSRSETFGVVVIEALATGRPVVSTRCGGPEGILTEPYLGELCESDNPGAMASAIEKVLKNPADYPAERIRRFAVERYSFKSLARRLTDVYEGL